MNFNTNTYTLLDKNGKYRLLQATSPGGSVFYEVWRNREAKTDKVIKGEVIRKKGDLVSPSNEDFGVHAWCYRSLEKAKNKFYE